MMLTIYNGKSDIVIFWHKLNITAEKTHLRVTAHRRKGGGGVGKRRGLGPRNDVLTTCKAVTLLGGQLVIGVFPIVNILIKERSEPAEEMIKKLRK